MMIVKLTGGLGNQMFQYAMGFALAQKFNIDLAIDVNYYSNFGSDTRRYFNLNIFNISAQFASQEMIDSCLKVTRISKVNKLINRFNFNQRIIKELDKEFFVFHEINNLHPHKNYYLDGYWQNAKYFQNYRAQLMREFTLQSTSNPFLDNQLIIDLMNDDRFNGSIAIHIRRGDYINDVCKPQSFFGLDYYREAVATMRKQVASPLWLIFSDDPVWVQENISGLGLTKDDQVIFADQYQLGDYDLILMSYCHHQIIANSTFSWWSAWLNNNSDKIVIGPKRWIKGTGFNTSDILPKSWLSL